MAFAFLTTVVNIQVSEAKWSYMTGSEQYFTSLTMGADLTPFFFLLVFNFVKIILLCPSANDIFVSLISQL